MSDIEHLDNTALGNQVAFFDKLRNKIDYDQWTELRLNREYSIIKQENFGKYWVSTVWIGMNVGYSSDGMDMIFETMIFDKIKKDNLAHIYQYSYSTEIEALEGHEKAVEVAKRNLFDGE